MTNPFTRYPGWAVVAAWGLFNGVLAAVLAVYQGGVTALMLYVGAVVLIEAAGVAVLVSARRGPGERVRYRLPLRGAVALPVTAVGLTLAALTLAYGPWMLSLAVPLLLVSLALAVHRGAGGKGGTS